MNMKMKSIGEIDYQLLKARIITAILFLMPAVILLFAYPRDGIQRKNGNDELPKKTDYFFNISLSAKSVFVWDVNEKKAIYAKNEKEILPLASLSKVMTALLVLDKMPGAEHVKITDDSIKQDGDSGLRNDERWRLKDLIDFSLVTSSNDGIYAVASAAESLKNDSGAKHPPATMPANQSGKETARRNFIDSMNKKAEEIGLSRTNYLNETGLDISLNENGGYGSAEDMAKLFSYIIKNKPEVLEATARDKIELTSLDSISHTARNTNEIVGAIPNLIASKTGFTDISGGNLVVAFDFGLMKPIVISVLGSTREGRFEDMNKLVEAVAKYLADDDKN